jgi:hypothetical protein
MKQIVSTFKKEFMEIRGRDPIDSETIDNLKDKIDVKTITAILEELNREHTRIQTLVTGDSMV